MINVETSHRTASPRRWIGDIREDVGDVASQPRRTATPVGAETGGRSSGNAASVLRLQRSAGNTAVAQAIQSQRSTSTASSTADVDEGVLPLRHQISVVVPRATAADVAMPGPAERRRTLRSSSGGVESDAPSGAEGKSDRILAVAETPRVEEPEPGATVTVPDIELPELEAVEEQDAIVPLVPYAPTINKGGAAPSGFGVTRPYTFSLTGIAITNSDAGYIVSAVLNNPIKYQVRASTGPSRQKNITSDSDADITSANYRTAASDLTPDTSDLNGRPPRTQFWSNSLTVRHERFHCTDGMGHALAGATNANAWLAGQTASSAAQVTALLGQVPQRVINARRANMTYPGREERAYGDGASAYRALANAITAKGDAGGY